MLRKIIETIFSKGITAICNLLILLITANYLGTYGRGEMAIIVLGITIVGLFQNILSGSILAYMIPRFQIKKILSISFLWIFFISVTTPFVLISTNLFPNNYLYDLIYLSILLGLISLIQNTLIGLEEIRKQNYIEIAKAVATTIFLLWFIVFKDNPTIDAVITTFYFAYIVTFFLAIFLFSVSYKKEKQEKIYEKESFLPLYFKVGFQMQLNNISQAINYRFCYFLIEKYLGLSVLGIFSVATSLMESVWVICRGIGVVHYSKSVNLSKISQQIRLTQKLLKISFLTTLLAIVIVFLLPNELYTWLIGKDFGNFKLIFLSLAPGTLFLSTFTIINYHFSSNDNNWINIKSSIIGNLITIIIGFGFIHQAGIYTGGIATSFGYGTMLCYLLFVFTKKYNLSFSWLKIKKSNWKTLFSLKEFD